MPALNRSRLRATAGAARNRIQFVLGQAGFPHSSSRMVRDAARYWSGAHDDRWLNDSHWRSGSVFDGTDRWAVMGQEHLQLFHSLRRTMGEPAAMKRIVDWGCGGGANAVLFAPLAEELIGVDVSADSLEECARQMAEAGSTPFVEVLADMAEPEKAAVAIPQPCDLFLCLYVLELVPTQQYGLRIMRIGYDLLRPGGQAFVQIKYATESWRTRPRRRSYRSAVADNTYRIEEFWTAMAGIGFRPVAVALVPKNDLDERYAYFLLSKP